MVRVCFISPSFPYMNCGVGDYTAELVKSLTNSGLQTGVITSDSEKIKEFAKTKEIGNFEIFPIVKRWDFANLHTIVKKIKDFKPDVIHIQYHWWISNDGLILKGLMLVLLPWLLKLSRIKSPVITTLHSRLSGPFLFPKAAFLRHLALIPLLLFSDKIIVTNRYDGRKLSSWLPFLKNKIVYTLGGSGHYLVDEKLKEEAARLKFQLKDSESEILLSNFGYVIPYKGFEELLEAMSALRKRGYPLRLVSIGGFDIELNFAGAYFEKLQKMARDLNLEEHIKWAGFCDARQASLFLLASDICVMPFPDGASEWRSSFLDALSHGLPVVTTFSEKTPEELVNRVNCLLVPPHAPQRLTTAIEELISSIELRNSLGRAAQELFEKEYSWTVIGQKTIAVYENELRRVVNN